MIHTAASLEFQGCCQHGMVKHAACLGEPLTDKSKGGGQTGGELASNCKSKWPAQIRGTEAEPQQIIAQRLLSCLQYHVP